MMIFQRVWSIKFLMVFQIISIKWNVSLEHQVYWLLLLAPYTYARRHLSFHYLIKSNKYLFNLKTKKNYLSFKIKIG